MTNSHCYRVGLISIVAYIIIIIYITKQTFMVMKMLQLVISNYILT